MKLGYWLRYKQYVSDVVLSNVDHDERSVSYWRSVVFCNILTYLTPLSVIALIPSVFMSFRHDLPVVGIADLSTFFLFATITLVPGIKLAVRKSIFIILLYGLSVTLLYFLPIPAPGLLFLLTATIFSSLIYSSSAAYYSALANTILCLCFGLLIYFNVETPIVGSPNLGAWIAVSSNLIFLSFACAKCLELLLSGLIASINSNTIAEGKIKKANRLYKFISHINQSIVHIKDEHELLDRACKIAIDVGQFKLAYIAMLDEQDQLNVESIHDDATGPGIIIRKSSTVLSDSVTTNATTLEVIRTGKYVCNNDLQNDNALSKFKDEFVRLGIHASIALPIYKSGQVVGVFSLHAVSKGFFDIEEINLLQEAASDISFALDIFEKDRRHKLYTLDEFLNTPATEMIHPDDFASVIEKVQMIMQTDGSSFDTQHRLKHRNGYYIWCEGTMTNLLNVPHVNAIVSNFRDITARKQAEELIIKNENRFRALIEKSTDIKMLSTVGGEFIYGSPSVTNVFGYTNEEFLNKSAFTFFHPNDLPHLFKNRSEILEVAGASFSFQYRLLHKNGSWIWCEGTLTNLLHEPGINALVSNFKDITKSRQAEQEAKELTNRLHLATSSAGMGIWAWNIPDNTLHWDERMYGLYRIAEKEVSSIYEGWVSRLHEDDSVKVARDIQNAINGTTDYNTEFRIVLDDSTVRHIKATGILERDAEGNAVRLIGANWDITEMREKEEQIRRSEIFNRGLINSITAHIAVLNDQGTIVAVNSAWEQFGFANGAATLERIGVGANYFKTCEKAIEVGDVLAADVLQGMRDVLNERQQVFYLEYPCHSPTENRWFGIRVMKFEGKERLIIALHTDVTDRKMEEQEKERISSDLIQRNKNLEQFSYIVSHNLRAPVANILGLTELLQLTDSKPGLDLDATKALSAAAHNLDKVMKDLNEILQVRMLVSEAKEELYFQGLVDDILLSVDHIVQKEGAIIHTNFKNIDSMLSVKSYLYSIFYNLIINSIKFHKPGVPPIIDIESMLTPNGIQLTFKDNGMGIDLERNQKNVFGLYKRFHHHVEGKGMGMFMVKTQVEALGGQISVSSEVNRGTEFTIEFSKELR